MSEGGLHEQARVSVQGGACERYEIAGGAMTLGVSSDGDVLCILSGTAGAGFAAPLSQRLDAVLTETGRVRLWLDLFDLTSIDEDFRVGLGGWLSGHGEQVSDARAVVAHDVAARAVAALNQHLGGRIEVLGDPESQAELYARFARGS